MPKILATLACNLENELLQTSLPLFEAEKVEAIEWSFDTLFKMRNTPGWFTELLEAYGRERRLIGHGVYFSIFSGKWLPEQEDWLKRLKRMSAHFHFDHITEHFGYMTGRNFHAGAPISIPFNARTLALGQDRLKHIHNACECPVGLENLALAYSLDDVKKQGVFLEKLIEPINGFIILDLHNLYCQIHNFEVPFSEIIQLYPLERVREIHISGGSWSTSQTAPEKKVRRDTHDSTVPSEVFQMLENTIPICPNLKYVVLEQLGTALQTQESQLLFQKDFEKMRQIIRIHENQTLPSNNFLPDNLFQLSNPKEDAFLYAQQIELSDILETSPCLENMQQRLANSSLAHSDWEIEKWTPFMAETVLQIAQKWKNKD